MRRLFGTDGVRGIANTDLTAERALSIGRAIATVLSGKKQKGISVIVGYDTRQSSEMLAAALSAGLSSGGASVTILGVLPTPAVAYLVTKQKRTAGVMISASHNSFEYNGIKVFGGDGKKLPDELEMRIESIVLDEEPPPRAAEASEVGRISLAAGAAEDYLSHLRAAIPSRLDGMRIGVDCANGVTSFLAEGLFSSLGAECYVLSSSPDGKNINLKCGSTDLSNLSRLVVSKHLDLGVAFDGDADRCLAVDENGEEIDGDKMMALFALDMKERGALKHDTVVGTVMTNLGFSVFCKKNGIGFIPAKVGDRYVLEAMDLEGLSFGGEQSGHIIFRDAATTGDGLLTAGRLLSLVRAKGKMLSELASVMKRYPQYLKNLTVTPEEKLAFFTDQEITAIVKETEKQLGDRGRLVVRPSGTEPYLRVMIEGEDEKTIKEMTERVSEQIRERLLSYRKEQ